MSEKKRLDIILFERGLASSREQAKALIMSGIVYVNGQKSDKAGLSLSDDTDIEVRGNAMPFVSRGGLKLQKALDFFGVSPKDKIAMDVGASTGGFSDCMLKRGVKKIYAIDVGYGQLAWEIRQNPSVVVMERTNIRYVTKEQIPDEIDLAVIDVSFISLSLVLPVVKNFMSAKGEIICLIKPQFEAGREKVGKKGVVRDSAVHIEVLEKFLKTAQDLSMSVKGITFSPIKGPEGNIEYLGYLSVCGEGAPQDIEEIVRQSHETL